MVFDLKYGIAEPLSKRDLTYFVFLYLYVYDSLLSILMQTLCTYVNSDKLLAEYWAYDLNLSFYIYN